MATNAEDKRSAEIFGSLLAQVILEGLIAKGLFSLADAVNVAVQVRDLAKQGGDPEHDQAAQAARALEAMLRKRHAEAEGHRSN